MNNQLVCEKVKIEDLNLGQIVYKCIWGATFKVTEFEVVSIKKRKCGCFSAELYNNDEKFSYTIWQDSIDTGSICSNKENAQKNVDYFLGLNGGKQIYE